MGRSLAIKYVLDHARMQLTPLLYILGFIYAILEYRDMFRAFGPHQIPIG